jgi:hypothetical protein
MMPSHSKKQHAFMEAIAHSPKFAKKVNIAPSVGKHFVEADKREHKFKRGGKTCEMSTHHHNPKCPGF